ncbi:hypothetical protein [Microcoleus sp. EPA2]|uniref:hypothetical protein n=1 Tax=unclassified Microcoleus TaxID=2642155 RepID=UPI00312BB640
MRFLVQCDSVLVLFGARTGSDDFTCLSVMSIANFSDNYSVTLGKLFMVCADHGSWGGLVPVDCHYRRCRVSSSWEVLRSKQNFALARKIPLSPQV